MQWHVPSSQEIKENFSVGWVILLVRNQISLILSFKRKKNRYWSVSNKQSDSNRNWNEKRGHEEREKRGGHEEEEEKEWGPRRRRTTKKIKKKDHDENGLRRKIYSCSIDYCRWALRALKKHKWARVCICHRDWLTV